MRKQISRRQFTLGVTASLCVGVIGRVNAQSNGSRGRVGRAYDKRSGKLLYQERHTETLRAGNVTADEVRYLDAAGKRFALKRVDFGNGTNLPDFLLDNQRTGHLEGATRQAPGEVDVQYREQAGAPARVVRMPAPAGAIADAGFDRFIESEWDALRDGDRPVRPFLVPSRFEYVDFRIRRTAEDARSVRFAMEIDSALMRLLAPSISVEYDRETRRLLSYEGPSNLRDASGDNYDVRIEF